MKNIVVYLVIIIPWLFTSCKQTDGRLAGVVTYSSLNKDYTINESADVGANIYIVKRTDFDSTKVLKILNSQFVFVTYHSIEVTEKSKQLTLERTDSRAKSDLLEVQNNIDGFWNTMKSFGINTQEEFAKLSFDIKQLLNEFKSVTNGKSIVANGNGSYSTNLTPGKYYVLFQSSARKGKTAAEEEGKFEIRTIEIDAEKESTINTKFGT